MSYELTDFKTDVIDTSEDKPVVIDFWAEWCGPCRHLSPILEKLAGEANGSWQFVKINTDKHPDIAAQFNVRGIPAVKMVYQKQIIAEFTGAQPEPAVRKWLSENLPGNGKSDSDDLIDQVNELLKEGRKQDAKNVLRKKLNEDTSPELRIKLAMLMLPDNPDAAVEEMEKLGEDLELNFEIEKQVIETVRHLKNIMDGSAEPSGDNDKAEEYYREGINALFDEDYDHALQRFIETIQIDRQFDDDGARKAAIACFNMLGNEHPISKKYRRRFSMALY